MTKFICLILLFSLPIQALQILQPTNDNQVIQQQLDIPQLDTPLSAEQLLTKLKISAKRGDARSQFSLANMYHNGINVTKDDKLAFYWYFQVAEQNYATAQFNVANGYYYGIGVGKDLEQALYWYEKSAQQGHPEVRYHLALLQLTGDGVDKNVKKALTSLLDLSAKGHQVSQYQLYLIYNKGDVVAKDEVLAKTYLFKAAKAGYAKAQYQLGKSFFFQDMAKEATYYLELAANQNNTSAVKLLKKLSFKPQQAVQNKQEKSNIQNIANITKPVVTIEPIMAKMPWQSMTPLPIVDFNLNQQLFDNTIPLIPNQDEIAKSLSHNTRSSVSLETLLASVEQGDPIAQYNLSVLYAKGEVVPKDNRVAFILMRQSANQGITQSQNALAIMYIKGAGVQINYDKAYYWSSITTRKGSQEGKLILLYLIANL
jgi:TPR repeat protein